jgi:4-aminobutyrate aminotransferase-like enzyme
MIEPTILHADEPHGNAARSAVLASEPRSLRTYTPTQAVIASSEGVYHYTPDGRKLFDYTSGVLVANLGHNPTGWTRRFFQHMGYPQHWPARGDYFRAVPMTAYNAATPIEGQANARLLAALRRAPGGGRMESVMWAASGSEAVQKALWAGMAVDKSRPMILATRFGFHGKKGLALAVTGSETDPERDPRVKFISFPMHDYRDVADREKPFDPSATLAELHQLWHEHGGRFGTLITEPYLGGGGSFHPPKPYLQTLQQFCREKNIIFILDEVQANFGRCGTLFAFEKYGLEPDLIVLGKGLGNGVPVAAAVGRRDIWDALNYGDASDTWSANPLNAASVLATLDEFESRDILGPMQRSSQLLEEGLISLRQSKAVRAVRGERGGMVWGVEFHAAEQANAFVLAAYRGDGPTGVHLLGPLSKTVVRISPPLTITVSEVEESVALLRKAVSVIL